MRRPHANQHRRRMVAEYSNPLPPLSSYTHAARANGGLETCPQPERPALRTASRWFAESDSSIRPVQPPSQDHTKLVPLGYQLLGIRERRRRRFPVDDRRRNRPNQFQL